MRRRQPKPCVSQHVHVYWYRPNFKVALFITYIHSRLIKTPVLFKECIIAYSFCFILQSHHRQKLGPVINVVIIFALRPFTPISYSLRAVTSCLQMVDEAALNEPSNKRNVLPLYIFTGEHSIKTRTLAKNMDQVLTISVIEVVGTDIYTVHLYNA